MFKKSKLYTKPTGQNDMKKIAYILEHGIQKGIMITPSLFTSEQ